MPEHPKQLKTNHLLIHYKSVSLRTQNLVPPHSRLLQCKIDYFESEYPIERMRKTHLVWLPLLALMLCKSCSSVPNFGDLPDKALYSIADQLELDELVNMAMVNTQMCSVSNKVFENKFQHLETYIEVLKRHRHCVKYYVFFHVRNHIIIYDYELALNILQYFGSSIHALRINNVYVTRDQSARIYELANKYAAGAVTSLNLDIMRGNTLEQFTRPFERVENLTCDISVEQTGANILPFDQLFPRLKSLTIKLNADLDHKYLNCTLPHLERLCITKTSFHPDRDTRQIDDFIRKHPTIQSVEVSYGITDVNILFNAI